LRGYLGKIRRYWVENSRKPVLGFRLSGGKGILQRSQAVFFYFRQLVTVIAVAVPAYRNGSLTV
ncbi:TPA: hypothetical protein ACFNMZ_000886, partial [Neisseria polysaccharea]